ncbi:MAG: shikimate kinase [Actinomycetota bacterium]|nr:shikimate kinase [Actinomycetota bacterium]
MLNIALVGPMGSGKTTVGRVLSSQLGYQFIDVDQYVEKKAEKSIPEIFSSDGEDAFRQLESEALVEILQGSAAIISCGGGIVLREENRKALKQKAFVVYLKAEPSELFVRVGNTADKRPLLNVSNPKVEIDRLLKEREPLYQDVADLVVDTTGKNLDEVVESIIEVVEARKPRECKKINR